MKVREARKDVGVIRFSGCGLIQNMRDGSKAEASLESSLIQLAMLIRNRIGHTL